MSSPASAGEVESARWSREDEKAFENALATVPYPTKDEGAAPAPAAEDRWLEAVGARVPGKTIVEVKKHYGLLVEDVNAIEAGRVPIPRYADDSSSSPRSGEQVFITTPLHGHYSKGHISIRYSNLNNVVSMLHSKTRTTKVSPLQDSLSYKHNHDHLYHIYFTLSVHKLTIDEDLMRISLNT